MHESQLDRLEQVEATLKDVRGMIRGGSYCIGILTLIRRASNILAKMENDIFEKHLDDCVNRSFSGDDRSDREKKVREIQDLLATAR